MDGSKKGVRPETPDDWINAVAVTDLSSVVTYVNPSFLKLWGYESAGEVLGRTEETFFENAAPGEILKAVQAQGCWLGERSARHRDGSCFAVELVASFVKDRENRPCGLRISFLSLDGLAQPKTILRANFSRLRRLTDRIPAYLAYLDPDLRYRYVNQAYVDLFARPREALIGSHLSDLFGAEYYERNRESIDQALAGQRVGYETTLERPDRTLVLAVEYVPDLDAAGVVQGLCVLSLDITARQRAEEARRERADEYRLALEKASEAIFIEQHGAVVFANPAVAALLGVRVEEMLGRPVRDYIWPEDQEFLMMTTHLRRAGREGVPGSGAIRLLGADGRMIRCHLSTSLTQWRGEQATVNLLVDVTRPRGEERVDEDAEKKGRAPGPKA